MGPYLVVAAAVTATTSALYAHAFVPASPVATTAALSTFRGLPVAPTFSAAAAQRPRSRRSSTAARSQLQMEAAATQLQQTDSWQEQGTLKTRDIFNALSQGEIGKRKFTQALAKRMVAKATGMQQDYQIQSEAASLAASSSAAVEEGETRCQMRSTSFNSSMGKFVVTYA